MARHAKTDHLPAAVKARLERLLIDRDHGGYEALSDWLKGQGFDISKSAIHRTDVRLQRVMSNIKASAEAARMIVQASPDDADEHSAAVIRMVQSKLFDALVGLQDADDEDPAAKIKLLSGAARAIADASRASIGQKRWSDEVKAKLDAVEAVANKAGKTLDAATLQTVREALYGG